MYHVSILLTGKIKSLLVKRQSLLKTSTPGAYMRGFQGPSEPPELYRGGLEPCGTL